MAIGLLLVGCSHPPSTSSGKEWWFIVPAILSSDLLHLRPDGTAITYDRQHMYVKKDRVGTWSLVAHDRFEMRFPGETSNIMTGHIELSPPPHWQIRLPKIRSEIRDLLSRNPGRDLVEGSDLEALGHWEV